jgi:uncharacterized protein
MAFMVALALGGILRAWMGRLPGALVTGAVVDGATWFMVGALSMALMAGGVAMLVTLAGGMGLLTTMGGGGRGQQGGNGGFSGGGGGFGGGGASGRW